MISAFYRGDTKRIRLVFETKEPGRPSEPRDITGHEFWITFKQDPGLPDSRAAFKKMVEAPVDSESTAGRIEIVLESDETALLIPDLDYHYDIQRVIRGVDPEPPDVKTLIRGKVRILRDITVTNEIYQ